MLLLLAALSVSAALPTQELHTQRFNLVYTERAAKAAQMLATEIESRRDEVTRMLGRDWEGTTEIRIGADRREFEALALTPAPSWASALAWPEQNVMLINAASWIVEGAPVLQHELVHIALGRLGDRWPRWFHEGFAQHLTSERKFSLQHYTTLANAVTFDRVFRFEDLTRGFPERPSDVEIAYAQSVAFVDFLFERHPPSSFAKLADGLMEGETFEIAFAKAFHTSLNLEERVFREQLPRKYSAWVVIASGDTMWAALAVFVVVGFFLYRLRIQKRRALQAQQEAVEDAVAAVALAAEEPILPPLPDEDETKPTIH